MGRRFERESQRPPVLRHAYQSETRRYTPRCPERTLLYRTVAENLEIMLRTAREQHESGLGLRDAGAFGELTRIFMEEVLARYRCNATKLSLSDTEGGALVFQHRFGVP